MKSSDIVIAVVLFVALTALLMFGLPAYWVWSAGKAGEANLNRAESEKKIMIEQAKAEVESAKLRAEAIREVGAAAKEFPEYRQQEFIGSFAQALEDGKVQQIIYVPTEACIPLTEANRLRPKVNDK